jgi:hypothetical protein
MDICFTLTEMYVAIFLAATISYVTGAVIEHWRMKGREKQSDTRRNNRILKTHYTGTTWLSNKSYTGTEKK